MKNVIFYLLFALFTTCASAQVTDAKIEMLPVASADTTVQLKVQFKTDTPVTYAVWHSTDLVNWVRAELEYGSNSPCIAVNTNLYPEHIYTMTQSPEGRDFFKIAPYIPTEYWFIRNLTVGMSGPDVANLQTFLSDRGYASWIHDEEKGYFGDRTRWALISYQTARGIQPASGFFGPLTRATVNYELNGTETP